MAKNSNSNRMDFKKEIEKLQRRVDDLEKKLGIQDGQNNNESKPLNNTEAKENKQGANTSSKTVKDVPGHDKDVKQGSNDNKGTAKKPLPKNAKNIEAGVSPTLEVFLTKDNSTIDIEDQQIVSNELVMGDDILIDTKNGKVDKLKVARRAKREIVEGLVTSKNDNLYAVTKFGVHKLFPYDVQTKGVYKGFEVNVILPKDKESQATSAIIKDIESTGDVAIEETAEIKKAPSHDPRVLEDDDLV